MRCNLALQVWCPEIATLSKTAQTLKPILLLLTLLWPAAHQLQVRTLKTSSRTLAPLQVTNDTATEFTDRRRKLQADVVRRQSHLSQVSLA